MLRWTGEPPRAPVPGRVVARCLEAMWEADARLALGYLRRRSDSQVGPAAPVELQRPRAAGTAGGTTHEEDS